VQVFRSATLLVLSLASLLSIGNVAPARAVDLPPLRGDRSPLFSADVVISLDPEGKPVLSVSVSVPYDELQWIKIAQGYASGAEFQVVFEPRARGREYGDVWERRVVVTAFSTTTTAQAAVVERRTFDVPPGRYRVRVAVRDLNSEGVSSAREAIDIPDYSRVPVGFADLELGVADSSGSFRSLPTRQFGMNSSRLAVRVILFDRRPGGWPRVYPFHYRILDESGGDVVNRKHDVTLNHSAEAITLRPDSLDLFIGSYVFEVELVEGRSRWRVDRSFEVEESGPPRGREFEKMLEPLAYIAESWEIDHLRSLEPERQAEGWLEFWRRRDPSPDTPRNEALVEFFRRVRFADQHFQSYGPGWRSDMGRIYIKFGPPDQIENRPPTPQAPQLEVWYYNRPYRRFVFADREGFGRFVLMNPAIE